MTKAVRPLIESGYVVEEADDGSRPALGRPANPVKVDGGRAFFVGVKVTADEVIGVLTDLCCRIRVARHVPLTALDPASVIGVITALADELLAEAEDYGVRVQGLGVAVSGDVNRAAGVVRYSPFLGWHDIALAELAAEATGLPVTVDNDVRALTIAEQWFGGGVGCANFALALVTVGIGIGIGIGCGLVVNGRVVSGSCGVAGEIGHVPIDPQGPRCHCGNTGCVEAIASDSAIVRRIREDTGHEVADSAQALALAHGGNPGARAAYARRGPERPEPAGPGRPVPAGCADGGRLRRHQRHQGHEGVTADDLNVGYREIIARARAAGKCVVGATVLPYKGWSEWNPAEEAVRRGVNAFVRTSGEFDAVADFERIIRSPYDAERMLPTFDGGDHLHPNDKGMQAMADSIDIGALDCDGGSPP